MGLKSLLRRLLAFVVRTLIRIGETVLALATLAGYVLLWLTLRQPDVTLTSRVMQVLYLAVAAVSSLLALLVLVDSYRRLSKALGGFPSLPSRSSSGGSSSGGSTLSSPDIGSDDSYATDDAGGGGDRFGVDGDDSGSSDGDSGGGDGSILGPHN